MCVLYVRTYKIEWKDERRADLGVGQLYLYPNSQLILLYNNGCFLTCTILAALVLDRLKATVFKLKLCLERQRSMCKIVACKVF